MFASSGYFRGLTCPYFASGLCERKYCHFRHVKQPDDGNGKIQEANKMFVISILGSCLELFGPTSFSSLFTLLYVRIQQPYTHHYQYHTHLELCAC